jgi:hypothetical protein
MGERGRRILPTTWLVILLDGSKRILHCSREIQVLIVLFPSGRGHFSSNLASLILATDPPTTRGQKGSEHSHRRGWLRLALISIVL